MLSYTHTHTEINMSTHSPDALLYPIFIIFLYIYLASTIKRSSKNQAEGISSKYKLIVWEYGCDIGRNIYYIGSVVGFYLLLLTLYTTGTQHVSTKYSSMKRENISYQLINYLYIIYT